MYISNIHYGLEQPQEPKWEDYLSYSVVCVHFQKLQLRFA